MFLLSKKTMVCVPIMEEKFNLVEKSALKAIDHGADILEFRIDFLKSHDPYNMQRLIYDLDYPIIATNRLQKEGGFFTGTEAERTDILIKAGKYAEFVDIELHTPLKYRNAVINKSNSTIISFHDFENTPPLNVLLEIIDEARKIGDIAKFAVMPNTLQDTLTVLEVLIRVRDTIGISMGDKGKFTRIIAPIFGSPITYASLDNESAPGQLDVETTKKILKMIQ
ncbi:MAG: type I 3-dehydroquinate dehydratase [Methanobacteriaceae archaeon]|nr:type I 3-dehydroquinate dehydratase [Methanobacteriaceae archaeon]